VERLHEKRTHQACGTQLVGSGRLAVSGSQRAVGEAGKIDGVVDGGDGGSEGEQGRQLDINERAERLLGELKPQGFTVSGCPPHSLCN
jgi:hypothetical protein